jgi:hypothetical protein
MTMRFRLGLVTGLAAGYYLGARAGRQRYDQINRTVARIRRTEAYQSVVDDAKSAVEDVADKVTDKAKAVVEEGVEKARAAIHHNHGHSETAGTELPGTGSPTDHSSSR